MFIREKLLESNKKLSILIAKKDEILREMREGRGNQRRAL
jgi:hypothetical protein